MTKIDALNIALGTVENSEAKAIYEKMIAQLQNRKPASDEAKARAAAKRKEKVKTARAEFLTATVPMVREVMTKPMTAKEIASAVDGVTAAQISYMIAHNELGEGIEIIPDGRNANKYMIKTGA